MKECPRCLGRLPNGCVCATETFEDTVKKIMGMFGMIVERDEVLVPAECGMRICQAILGLHHNRAQINIAIEEFDKVITLWKLGHSNNEEITRLERQFLNEVQAHDRTRQDLEAKNQELRRIQENFYQKRIDNMLENSNPAEEEHGSDK